MRTGLILLLLAAAAVSLLALRPRAKTAPAIDQQFAVDLYAGSSTCVGCHRRESEEFVRTAHARALVRADSEAAVAMLVGRSSPEPSSEASEHGRIEFNWTGGQLWATRPGSSPIESVPIQWCFGSGEFGTTYVTLLEDRRGRSRLLEHHWSWFHDEDVLALTPGHTLSEQARGFDFFGQIYDSNMTRQCFACHATTFTPEAGRIKSDSVVAGIQCERCHGPRKAHVEAKLVERSPPPVMTRPRPTARQQVYACGECHRRPDEIDDPIRPDNALIARFPSVGLVQSKCFLATESQGSLTCTTCHDPHDAQRPPASSYDNQCRDCHDPRRNVANVPCSDKPGDRSCIGCHMPKVILHEHLKFTDHWIRTARIN